MSKKRGQITIFIIVGIVLVIITSIVFFVIYNVSESKQPDIKTPMDTELIRIYINDCVERSTELSLMFIGAQGGYLYQPEQRVEVGDTFIAYDYYGGKNLLPSKEQIENDISNYIEEDLNKCSIDLQTNFNNYDYEFGEMEIDTKIKESSVLINVIYPITIKNPDGATQIKEFGTKVPIRLNYILEIVNKTIEAGREEPNWVNFGLLSSFDVNTNMLYYGDDVVYIFEDSKSKINNQNYTFVFALKLAEDFSPELFAFDDYEVKAGELLNIKAKAIDFSDDKITYSGMDVINKDTGVIKFSSSIQGIYTFKIRATDSKGNYDEEKLIIKVI